MSQIYSLDNAIAKFFLPLQGITRQQCDEHAISLVGPPASPCPIQGAFSYTVYAGTDQSKVVQFRCQKLDTEVLDQAHSIFGRLVAKCAYHGYVGNASRLEIYIMERIKGVTYIEARMTFNSISDISEPRRTWQNNVVVDFARFFALSWKRPFTMRKQNIAACQNDMDQKLKLLSRSLPSCFAKTMLHLSSNLEKLFSNSYPLVLTHDDLCEMNVLVDPHTGHINGIIDWSDAKIQPFGLSLWGLENVLGYMDSEGWHYFGDHKEMEDLFWTTFEDEVGVEKITKEDKERIKLARLVGIALRYGFQWDSVIGQRPISESDSSLKYLSAFIDTDE